MISIPVDLSVSGSEDLRKLEEPGVRGRYASVEQFTELEDGSTEWRMAVSGITGGMIPMFISEFMMPSKIAQVREAFTQRKLTDVWHYSGCPPVFQVAACRIGNRVGCDCFG